MANFTLKIFGKNFFELRSGSETLENPRYSFTDPTTIEALFGDDSKTKLTHDSAITYSAVWRAVSLLSGTIAGFPKFVQQRQPNGDRIRIETHPVQQLLTKPAPNMNRFTWFERAMCHVLLWGDTIAPIIRDRYYNPVALPLMHPAKVQVTEKNGQLYYKFPEIERTFQSNEVIHIVGFGDGIRGKDPISVARESLEGGLIFQQTGNNFFKNGYLNDRYLTMPGRLPDKGRDVFVDSIKNAYTGMKNSGKLMVLEGGTELKSIGMPPENMQFLQSKQHHITEVARWFGVPPHKLADLERSTNNNIEHQAIEFVQDSILPWVLRFETELNDKLFFEDEKTDFAIKFNMNGLLRGDLKTRAEYYTKATGGRPWMKPDEVRSLEDENKLGGDADRLIDPANIIGTPKPVNNNNNNDDNKN